MQLLHHNGDLFQTPEWMPLAHCISQDARMGKGIAVQFQNLFNLREEIQNSNPQVGSVVPIWRGQRLICNLITKKKCFHKPALQDIFSSLTSLRSFMFAERLTVIGIPRLAAGLDGVPLQVVISMLTEVFWNTPVTIHMFHF